ncbi:MAG: DNA topoisomerase III [Paludibacteraceae bacterium]|nr:DNA topoisomerase III [Paludibacteraceae bacterium]
MIVCIAEKPSVGRDIAKVLGATTSHEGYMEGNGYQVTWTYGHLCGLRDPEDYNPDWKRWSMNTLPMLPKPFGIKEIGNRDAHKQFKVIQSLFKNADEIINCGDAGQEGELIQRWVQQQAGAKCPVKRLWISSLTEEAIREGFRQLKDQSEYQRLYEAGLMRAIGDWMLGLNATRAYTLRYKKDDRNAAPADKTKTQTKKTFEPLSVGRVQTPTLALIVQRQWEIDHFVPKTYWEVKTEYRGTVFNAIIRKDEEEEAQTDDKKQAADDKKKTADDKKAKAEPVGIDPITSAEEGAKLIEQLKQLPFMVTKVEKKKGSEFAPRLFDLTSLQVECNKKYGYDADKTLKLIQSLYEKHVATYPRVDTTFLSDDIYPKVPGILKGIESFYPQVGRLRELMRAEQEKTGKPQKLPKSKKVFDNSKVTDHHAIIPTGQPPKALTPEEQKVFDLIALRFIAAFYPECKTSTTTVWGVVADEQNRTNPDGNGVPFRTSGRQILFPGWREVFEKDAEAKSKDPDDETAAEDEEKVLPDFQPFEMGPHKPALLEKQTTPPKPYTEGTLLRAMETAGKTVEDEELRDALKENGIGRPSTRAEIIKKLFQRKYITQSRKSLFPTPLAIELIQTIHTPILKSAELTGQWEKKLRMIERGEMEAKEFLDELKQLTVEVVNEVKNDLTGYLCPVCRRGTIIRGRTAFGCSRWREGCTYRVPFATTTPQ